MNLNFTQIFKYINIYLNIVILNSNVSKTLVLTQIYPNLELTLKSRWYRELYNLNKILRTHLNKTQIIIFRCFKPKFWFQIQVSQNFFKTNLFWINPNLYLNLAFSLLFLYNFLYFALVINLFFFSTKNWNTYDYFKTYFFLKIIKKFFF